MKRFFNAFLVVLMFVLTPVCANAATERQYIIQFGSEATYNGSYYGHKVLSWFENKGTLTLDGATIRNNIITTLDATKVNHSSVYNDGGVLYITGNVLNPTVFYYNQTVTNGGAISNMTGSINGIEYAEFSENHSKYGGAIYNNKTGSINTITNTIFEKNTASTLGGAIYSTGSIYKIDGCDFEDNAASGDKSANAGYGGAIYANKNLIISNSVFKGNRAYRKGGAIAQMNGNLTIIAEDTTVTDTTNGVEMAVNNAGYTEFSNNIQGFNTSSANRNDIYMGSAGQNLNLIAYDSDAIVKIDSGIDFNSNLNIYVNYSQKTSTMAEGTVIIGGNVGSVKNRADLYLGGGSLSFANRNYNDIYANKVVVNNDTTMGFDISLSKNSTISYDTLNIYSISGTGRFLFDSSSFNILLGFDNISDSATLSLIKSTTSNFRNYIAMIDENGDVSNIIYIYDPEGTVRLYKVKLTSEGQFVISSPEYIDKVTNPLCYALNYKDGDYYSLVLNKNIVVDSWEDIEPDTPRNIQIVETLFIDGKKKTITGADNIVGLVVNPSGDNNGWYLTIQNTTFMGFKTAITNNGGIVTLNSVSFQTNTNKDENSNGGAIANIAGVMNIIGTPKSTKSLFYNNTAENGGAIYNSGEMDISYSNFGSSPTKKASFQNKADKGGAIYNLQSDVVSEVTESGYDSNLKVKSSVFTANTAVQGGAVYNTTEDFVSESVLFESDTFTSNKAEVGGAIYNNANMLTLTTTFGNKSKKATLANVATEGGAVYNAGDGVYTTKGSFYYSNYAEKGGAIYNTDDATVFIKGTTLQNNTATRVVSESLAFESFGGAIYNAEGATLDLDQYLYPVQTRGGTTIKTVDNTFMTNNANYGGAIYNAGDLIPTNIDETTGMPVNIMGAFTKNTATFENQSYQIDRTRISDESVFKRPLGGAIYNTGKIILTNSTFTQNSTSSRVILSVNQYPDGVNLVSQQITKFVGKGGAIYSDSDEQINIINSTLTKNTAQEAGGAIYNENASADIYITNSDFVQNTAKSIVTTVTTTSYYNGTKTKVKKTTTKENVGIGGAIYTEGNVEINTSETYAELFDQTTFTSNSAAQAGAIYAGGTVNGDNVSFTSNSATNGAGGAVYTEQNVTMKNAIFNKNTALENGGGIHGNQVDIQSSTFMGNKSSQSGGAIYALGDVYVNAKAYSDPAITYPASGFTSNSANVNGGAICSNGRILVKDTTFTSNSAKEKGGALYSTGDIRIINSEFTKNSANQGGALYVPQGKNATIINTSFTNNTAKTEGGAIYADEGSEIYLVAYDRDVVISGNKAGGKANSIYLNNAKIYVDAYNTYDSEGKVKPAKVTISDGVTGVGNSEFRLRGEDLNLHITDNITNLSFKDDHSTGAHIDIDCEELIQNVSFDLSGSSTYNISNGNIGTLSLNNLNLTDGSTTYMNIDMDLGSRKSDTVTANNLTGTGKLNVTKVNLLSNSIKPVEIEQADNSVITDITATRAETDEATYKLKTYLGANGRLRTLVYNQRAKACVLAAPIAAQIGGYLTQINSYDQAFMNMDMNMLKTREERQAELTANKYASFGTSQEYETNGINYNSKGLWTRPYATFERVGLNQGPRVSSISYGNFFGGDADLKEMRNGWARQFSAYIGYNGSVQDYFKQSIDQNGGTIGITEVWYKNNFFTGLTANVSGNMAQASTDLGHENMPMIMAGVASKTGYNWELAKGKFVIQPNLLISYSFVHTFSHKNGRGAHVGSSPLNAIQVAPGVKFIFNLPKGWQPYFNINMRWNIMDKAKFSLPDVAVPQMSVHPYVEYGIGVQRKWGERFTGFGQALVRNGGRNGVMLSFGFRWALGK